MEDRRNPASSLDDSETLRARAVLLLAAELSDSGEHGSDMVRFRCCCFFFLFFPEPGFFIPEMVEPGLNMLRTTCLLNETLFLKPLALPLLSLLLRRSKHALPLPPSLYEYRLLAGVEKLLLLFVPFWFMISGDVQLLSLSDTERDGFLRMLYKIRVYF
jgi:hypothetical protein